MLPNDKEKLATAKFTEDGEVVYFPGNTILCHLPKDSLLFKRLNNFYSELKLFNDKHKILALLPVESYHMTVFDAVSQIDGKFSFPASFHYSNLEDSHTFIKNKLISSNLKTENKLIEVKEIKCTTGTIGLLVEGVQDHETRLRKLRNDISSIIEIRKQDHDEYLFHITLAYFTKIPNQSQLNELKEVLENFLTSLSDSEKQVLLDKAEFCTFDNMEKFTPIYLF